MFTLNSKERILSASKPLVMGIINATPDSFYTSSRVSNESDFASKIDQMILEGADIIDIGGQSSRPGAIEVSVEEEISRVLGPIEYIAAQYPEKWMSIDTTRSVVAQLAISAGAHIVNDISGGNQDQEMLSTVAELDVPFICTHMQGTPETMQISPTYTNVVNEVFGYFQEKIKDCNKAGIKSLILDPGFGFGKTIAHNYQIIKHLQKFNELGFPILVGVSRKSMIYKQLEITADEALNGTTVLNTYALLHGASIIRVHDVKEANQAVTLINTIMRA
jgi:dihydropteroate synthase